MRELVARRVVDADRAAAVVRAVLAARIEAADGAPLEDGGVVAVGNDRSLRRLRMRRPDHAEQGRVLCDTVDGPAGIEDLVAAVFGIRLREHHQFDVIGVATELPESVHQVVDFVVRQCQAERTVGMHQRRSPFGEHRHRLHRFAFQFRE